MTANPQAREYGADGRRITVFFVIFLIVSLAAFSIVVIYQRPAYFAEIPELLTGSILPLLASVIGLRAHRAFGGSQNLVGRLILYFSLSLVLYAFSAISLAAWGYGDSLLSFSWVIIFLAAQALLAYSSLITVRTLAEKIDITTVAVVTACLLVAGGVALLGRWINALRLGIGGPVIDLFLAVYPALLFFQLTASILLIRLLGKWYLARSLNLVAVGNLALSVVTPISAVILALLLPHFFAYFFLIGLGVFSSLYIVGLGMSRVRPRRSGPFSDLRS